MIDLNLYGLENDFAFLFKAAANNNNKEVILAHQYMEDELTHMLPVLCSPSGVGVTGQGWASFCPTRDLVDSYEMTDGKTIYESSLYDMEHPWENRDARLKKTFYVAGGWIFSDRMEVILRICLIRLIIIRNALIMRVAE